MKNIFKGRSKKVTVITIAAVIGVLAAGAATVYAVSGQGNTRQAGNTAAQNGSGQANHYYAEHNIPMEHRYDDDDRECRADGADIGIEKAKETALAQVKGADESHIVKAERDCDDGVREYDIEIHYNGYEYEFEITAEDGTIISSDTDYDDNDDHDDHDDYDDHDDHYDDRD